MTNQLGLHRPHIMQQHIDKQQQEIDRLRDTLKRIASGWPKPMQLARETLDRK